MRKMLVPMLALSAVLLVGCSATATTSNSKPHHSAKADQSDITKTFPATLTTQDACAFLATYTGNLASENEQAALDKPTPAQMKNLTDFALTTSAGDLQDDVNAYAKEMRTDGVGAPGYVTAVEKLSKDCAGSTGDLSLELWDASRKPLSVAQFQAGAAARAAQAAAAAKAAAAKSAAAEAAENTYVLKVTGTGSALVTYGTTSGQSQETVSLPWSKSIPDTDVSSGIISMNAQEQQSGTIGCSIQLGDAQPVTNSSSGAYAVVSCVAG